MEFIFINKTIVNLEYISHIFIEDNSIYVHMSNGEHFVAEGNPEYVERFFDEMNKKKQAEKEDPRDRPIRRGEFSNRVFNSLNCAGVKTLGQLADLEGWFMVKVLKNFGKKAWYECEGVLISHGLKMKNRYAV